jgi:hypothetical protein
MNGFVLSAERRGLNGEGAIVSLGLLALNR